MVAELRDWLKACMRHGKVTVGPDGTPALTVEFSSSELREMRRILGLPVVKP